MKKLLALAACIPLLLPAQQKTFTNPVLDSGPDPWVLQDGGWYYYMNTTRGLALWRTRDLTDLRHAEMKQIWTPEPDQPFSKDTWAPEIHKWDGKWYVYFAADAGTNDTHRIWVLENTSADPMQGEWVMKGKVTDSTDKWAIDASVFEANGQHYMIWSGWQGDMNGEQDIYIARMSNPWTISSERTLISAPTYDWEKHGDLPKEGLHINVNEGPEALVHGNTVWVFFSGSACWTPDYAIGAVSAKVDSNLLDPKSWKKQKKPLFHQDEKAGVFATGHNGFFKSPDGKQDWIIYHANNTATDGCGNKRSPRMQPFTWSWTGKPKLGKPVAITKPIAAPAQ